MFMNDFADRTEYNTIMLSPQAAVIKLKKKNDFVILEYEMDSMRTKLLEKIWKPCRRC